jgi:coenzyme F420-dependent glucose-6-phosphate dehydrogenase
MLPLKISVDLGEAYNDPMRFVESAVVAEECEFDTVWFGDHLLPWVHKQNRAAYVWSVMPAALERTKSIRMGPLVTPPIGGRYHPIILGQAAATLDNMYPGRFALGVGSGEAMSETRFFPVWPDWEERIGRLCEAVVLMRKMWEAEDYFDFKGRYFKLTEFFLYTKPKTKIPIYFAADGKRGASYAGVYGDHLVTLNNPDKCKNIIYPSFEASARKAGKDLSRMEKMVEVLVHFNDKKHGLEEVRRSGDAGTLAEGAVNERDPRRIQQMSYGLSDEKILSNVCFFYPPDELIEIIDKYRKAGTTHVVLVTHSFPDRIRLIAEKVLPYFTEK